MKLKKGGVPKFEIGDIVKALYEPYNRYLVVDLSKEVGYKLEPLTPSGVPLAMRVGAINFFFEYEA